MPVWLNNDGLFQFAVMLDIWVNSRESAMQLLFWRSFSDLGIAIRFMASFSLNKIACGHRVCYLSSGYLFCLCVYFYYYGILQGIMAFKIIVRFRPLCWNFLRLLLKYGFFVSLLTFGNR